MTRLTMKRTLLPCFLLIGLVPLSLRAEGTEPAFSTVDAPASTAGVPAFETVDSPASTAVKPHFDPWKETAAPESKEPDDDHTEAPKKDSKAHRYFSEVYQKLGAILSGRDEIVFFASMSAIQARLVYDDEVPNEIDPNAGRSVRPVASASVIYGQLNLGYRTEQWISWVGSVGAFVEADITDLRKETDNGHFGAGVYLAGPKGFRVLNYINPTLALGYRAQPDRCLQDQGAGYTPVDCRKIDWENVDYPTLRNAVAASDITNFYVSLNIAVPLDCLFDKEACEENTR